MLTRDETRGTFPDRSRTDVIPWRNISAHMLRMIQRALFQLMDSSLPFSSSAVFDCRPELAGDPTLHVSELVVSDCSKGVFSVAVAAVDKSSSSEWVLTG
jgi:hypothetical protein